MTNSIKLIAISVGKPQNIDMHGKLVSTAIIKDQVEGPVYISIKGPEGDKSAVHPDAVYALSAEHYNYWADELRTDRKKWREGFFGENLTIQGIDETKLRIGDILEIGNQVKLQVVSPRTPCTKLSWRLGQPDDFLRRFSLSGKTGFYLKVLEEGYIEAGDHIVHHTVDNKAMTMSELSRFLVAIDEATEDQLYHVLSYEHLGVTVQEMLRRRIATIKDLKLMKAGRWSGWRAFVIDKIIHETKDVKSFRLIPKDGKLLAGYRSGQFLTCRLTLPNGKSIIRTWTISDFDPNGKSYRITIKKMTDGVASAHMHLLEEGAILEVKPPNGSFTLDRGTYKHVVLISAGIGITPMVAMLRAHIEREYQPLSALYFIHVTQNGKTHAFREEVKALIQGRERIKILNYYTRPTAEDSEAEYKKGPIKISDLEILMEDNEDFWGNRWHKRPMQGGLFYLCGPTAFQESVTKLLLESGVNKSHIYTESFNPFSGIPIGIKAEKSKVTFARSGIEVEWTEEDDLTLLELAEKCGIDAPNSCRAGACETCECILKEGNVYYDHGHLANRSQQTVLTCCSKPGSEAVVIDL